MLCAPARLDLTSGWEIHSYSVNYYRAKDGRRHSLAVFGVLGRAHDDVVADGEHAADGAEDYDGEDGDDDAVRWC